MCGIAGFVDPSRRTAPRDLERLALEMAAELRYRGPDDEGAWAEARQGVALGHRRLAIQDLSQEGHQPMHSATGRYVLVYNGEIYNFRELRAPLESQGHNFRGHSDTEVILAAFSEWGIEPTLEHLTGMFAFAVWDRELNQLHLARDRAGEKPLYYGWSGGTFLFGSELKALRAHPQWQGELDREALKAFMRHNYIPAPRSIYRNIFKLPPGSLLTLGANHFEGHITPPPKPYWTLWAAAQAGLARPWRRGAKAAIEQLGLLLNRSVSRQMIADVPLGAFLSGGIDSSIVVALMQAQTSKPVRTFSIGFIEQDYDEAPFAKAVARHLGTQHTELYVQAGMLAQAIPRLPHIYDEPFADTSHIPTLLLSELARKQVTVCLTGDGGDELFGGYSLYRRTQEIWNLLSRIPVELRPRLATLLNNAASAGLELQGRFGLQSTACERLLRLSEILQVPDDQALYQMQIANCRDPGQWLQRNDSETPADGERVAWDALPTLLQRMMFWDFLHYLPDEVLAKVDRASMSVSLETRLPLLDRQIIEFAWSLPVALQQKRHGKWLLRQLLYQHVPRALVERPKQGFAAPVEEWLRGELRPWAEDLLTETRLCQEGFFQARTVQERWSAHLSRKRNWGKPLWNVLMFQSWLAAQKPQPARDRAPLAAIARAEAKPRETQLAA